MNRRIRVGKADWLISLCLVLGGLVILTTELSAQTVVPEAPPYVRGRLIVKFKSTGPHTLTRCAHCLFARHQSLDLAIANQAAGVDALLHEAAVRTIRPMFPVWHRDIIQDAKSIYVHDLDAIRQRFPQRAARIGQAVEMPDLTNLYVLTVPEETDIESLARRYAADPHVEFAQPDYLYAVSFIPNDPYYHTRGSWGQAQDDLWALKPDLINAEQAWDLTQGEGMVVAVVDSGIDFDHPDFYHDVNGNGRLDPEEPSNLWLNASDPIGDVRDVCDRQRNPQIALADDDCNGYVDDVRGWNFAENNNNPRDEYGHGTHVAGTIAARGDNGVGIIGVAPKAKIMAVKGLQEGVGGTSEDLAQSLLYAARMGADVINNSWALNVSDRARSNPLVEEAVRVAYGLGAVVVFGAGNEAIDVRLISPQNMTRPKLVVVAATLPNDSQSQSSNIGALLDVAAPGSGPFANLTNVQFGILSLKSSMASAAFTGGGALVVGGQYVRQRGTSMAAPHVSGLAALLLARPRAVPWSNEEVRKILRASAKDVADPGFDVATGAGRIDAAHAVSVNSILAVALAEPMSDVTIPLSEPVIRIRGTAAGPGFQHYQLWYGPGVTPTTWIPIGPLVETPVTDGALGMLSMQGLRPGSYWLRLEATTATGEHFDDLIRITLEADTFRRLSSDPSEQIEPKISGSRIVWTDRRNGSSDVYLYDLMTEGERRITTDPATQASPAISGDRIVWSDNRNGTFADLYLYDLATNMERALITDVGLSQQAPNIWNHLVVWTNIPRNGINSIGLYDFMTDASRVLMTGAGGADIADNRVVWTDGRHESEDIYLYDLVTGTEQRLTSDVRTQRNPAVSGASIVWEDERNGNTDIYLYDLTTNTERRLTSDRATQRNPAISGRYVVWEDNRSGDWDIYLYDLVANTEQQITAHPGAQQNPAISGTRVVWEDARNGNSDIYLYEILQGDGFEADTAPRPQGNGTLTVADWVQTGRYVAQLDQDELRQGNAFQRADCAPRETQGDGRLTITDWVQAGRYVAGFDNAPVAAGGPTVPTGVTRLARLSSLDEGVVAPAPRRLARRIARLPHLTAYPGQQLTIPIGLTTQGGEQALSMTVTVDPQVLEYQYAQPAPTAQDASLQVQTTRTSEGHLGVAVMWPAGKPLPKGSRPIVLVTYRVRPTAKRRSLLRLTDAVLPLALADAHAHALPLQPQAGSVQLKSRKPRPLP